MGIKKTTVATSVEKVATKASSKKADQPTDQKPDWDQLLINNSAEASDSASGKRYVNYLGKDRLIRQAPGWGSEKGRIVEFVIFATDEDGNPLSDLPEAKFGSAADVDYYKSKYPLHKGYYVNDSLCKNGRHRITFYHIHIHDVVNKPEVEVE